MDIVSIGFRAKTGKAIAVALTLQDSGPSYLARWEVSLCDSQVPETAEPHHAVMELPWSEAQRDVAPLEAQIETIAAERLSVLLAEIKAVPICRLELSGGRRGDICIRGLLPDLAVILAARLEDTSALRFNLIVMRPPI